MLKRIANILGVAWDGSCREGEPCGDFTNSERQIIDTCFLMPLEESEFIKLNLESQPEALSVKALATTQQWSSLKSFQCDLIRDLRRAAYGREADSLYFAYRADAEPEQVWLSKRSEIKERYPWPGEYR
ncbi:MAG: hypothetical protein HY912_02955 [Desulfomonile tiedjei]|uniref:Uncharacterized protein n=1 Tax=Desulfomonile tiedjei TaxID=2358 RepID=A0A9D6Z4Q4_9BACT|nr:hypothetical protein [Desulfomonile tiedjei]